MNTEAQISYDTSRPSSDRGAYSVSYAETDDATHALRQIGDVWNGIVRYRGVFATHAEAEQEARGYIKT